MAKSKRYPLGAFMNEFSTEAKCREYMANLRWAGGCKMSRLNYKKL